MFVVAQNLRKSGQVANGSNKVLLLLELMLSDATEVGSTHRCRFVLEVAYPFHQAD